ncbi:MAG: winged helix-turn-helix domain-containing protein [Actinobacteria bacterium]|nr:winged helix-turn-helix domain-containing protein [Actinomycetota bacterium]
MAEPPPARVLVLVSDDAGTAILSAIAAYGAERRTADAGARAAATSPSRSFELPGLGEVFAGPVPEPAILRVGPIEIDTRARRATLAGQPLELTRREYELLVHLAGAPGRVFTKRELLDEVWAQPAGSSTRRLDAQVARLRRRLGEHRALLVTVWGVGYRLG